MKVCKMFTFDAAHYLPSYEGKCRNLHGHTWKLEVEVSSDELIQEGSETGMVVDFAKVKDVVNREVINKLDHNLLNDMVKNPTCENLLGWIWDNLQTELEECHGFLTRLRLYETSDSYAECSKGGVVC